MKPLPRLVALAVMAAPMVLAACSSVSSSNPVGQPIDDATLAGYDGIWQASDGILYVKGINNGRAKAAWLEWEDDHFRLSEVDLIVADVGSAHYINMVEPTEDDLDSQASDDPAMGDDASGLTTPDKPAYYFFRLMSDNDGSIVLYSPRADVFKAAVKEGTLEGDVSENTHSSDVNITSPKETLEKFLDPEKVAAQFDLDSPLILMRVHSLNK